MASASRTTTVPIVPRCPVFRVFGGHQIRRASRDRGLVSRWIDWLDSGRRIGGQESLEGRILRDRNRTAAEGQGGYEDPPCTSSLVRLMADQA